MQRASIIAIVLLAVLLICGNTQAEVNMKVVKHKLMRREALCTQACTKMYKNKIQKCLATCSDIVMDPKATENVIKKTEEEEKEGEPVVGLADLPNSAQQEEATKQLWELYHRNMRQLLANGGWSAGFQLLQNAIDLTDITTIPGWESMPLGAIVAQPDIDDYDNMAVLAEELMQASKPGPFKTTDGTLWIDEYKEYLSGVRGIQSITVPDPDFTESARKAEIYEWTSNNCSEKYANASPFLVQNNNIEQFTKTFCPQVAITERAFYSQIGKEQAAIGNNPAYAAAVALGLAHGRYTKGNAFKKYQSFRSMEYECQMATIEGRPLKGAAKKFDFSYNFNTWKNTKETTSFSITATASFLNVTANAGFNSKKEIEKGFDYTDIGGVSVGWQDLRYIPLYPGDWYTSTALKDFRYYSRESGSSPIDRFFGTEGSLTLLPKGLYVGLNPSIGFEVKTEKKETFKKSTEMSLEAGLQVAGINLSGNYAKSKIVDQGTTTGGNSKITIQSTSCKPQLLAIENHYTY